MCWEDKKTCRSRYWLLLHSCQDFNARHYGSVLLCWLLLLLPQIMPAHVVAALQQQLAAATRPTPPHDKHRSPPTPTTTPAAAAGGSATSHAASQQQLPAVRAALRLARYSLGRCGAVLGLMNRLASVPESFEMARATGLTLNQVRHVAAAAF
jgi:hypothetical protein